MTQVTIGMPVFNGAFGIRAALDSLLAQTFQDFVIVISDNGSTDETEEICRAFQQRDERIRYVRQPVNLGAAMNFRFVLFEARTPYFMWAAADDLWACRFIETHLAVLNRDPRAVAKPVEGAVYGERRGFASRHRHVCIAPQCKAQCGSVLTEPG